MQKQVNLVDLVKSFLTSTYLQHLASRQPRTSRSKFADTNTNIQPTLGHKYLSDHCGHKVHEADAYQQQERDEVDNQDLS